MFDCLSELQTAWATDLMMGNFFRLTCPFLFILDTIAFFPVIRGKHMMLMAPGRIGTSSPELGVPTSFADISCFNAICEIAESRAGYMPELSYGSHFFQDLVEAGIIYNAVFDNEKTILFQPELLEKYENLFTGIVENGDELAQIIHVCDVSGANAHLYHDIGAKKIMCAFHQAD